MTINFKNSKKGKETQQQQQKKKNKYCTWILVKKTIYIFFK